VFTSVDVLAVNCNLSLVKALILDTIIYCFDSSKRWGQKLSQMMQGLKEAIEKKYVSSNFDVLFNRVHRFKIAGPGTWVFSVLTRAMLLSGVKPRKPCLSYPEPFFSILKKLKFAEPLLLSDSTI